MALRSDLGKLTQIMETNKDMSQQAWNEISASIKDTIGAIRSEFSMNIRSAVTHAVTESTLKARNLLPLAYFSLKLHNL